MHPIPSLKSSLFATVIFAAAVIAARGQAVIGSSGAMPSTAGNGISGFGVSQIQPFSNIASALAKPGPLWQAGPVGVRPHLSYEVVHGTGIRRILGLAPEVLTLQTFSLGIDVDLGRSTTADYTLSRKMYSGPHYADTTDHNALLQTGATYDVWKVSFSGTYGSNSYASVETGGQTHDERYDVAGTISYQLGRRTELELDFNHLDLSSKPIAGSAVWTGTDYELWIGSAWLRYHFSKDLKIAGGSRWGYDEIKNAPDMSHVEPQIQIAWKPTQKISRRSWTRTPAHKVDPQSHGG